MLRTIIVICIGVISIALVSVARADDQTIDNPAYKSWAKFNKGSSVLYSAETSAMGNTTNITTTQTLMDVTPDNVTLQVASSMVMGGNTMNMPVQTQNIPAKITKPADAPATQPVDASASTSTEDVQAAGKTFSCKKTMATMSQNGMTVTSTTWTCDDVPGGVVKMEANGSGTMTSTTKMVLSAMDLK